MFELYKRKCIFQVRGDPTLCFCLAKMKLDERQKRYRKTGVAGRITDVISLESHLIIYCNLKYKYFWNL